MKVKNLNKQLSYQCQEGQNGEGQANVTNSLSNTFEFKLEGGLVVFKIEHAAGFTYSSAHPNRTYDRFAITSVSD